MSSRRLLSRAGIGLMVVGLLIPPATYLGVHLWIESMPRVPPNQGAMVVAYFAHLASFAACAVTFGSGTVLLLVSRLQGAAGGTEAGPGRD